MKKILFALCLILVLSTLFSPLACADSGAFGLSADAYVYCLENGMPKYWLDFSGAISDAPVLHAYFRSGDPSFYESVFILDTATAECSGNSLVIRRVTDLRGYDCSGWFRSLTLRFEWDHVTMLVDRDERTLAGGEEDNILSGSYPMFPMGVDCVYEYRLLSGALKYWLETEQNDILLHAMFVSGDPIPYEEVFTLDTRTAERPDAYSIAIRNVYHSTGADVSYWFRSLTLSEVQGAILMNVKRDESTLAGGAGDNILTGVYLFEPTTYLCPAHKGPFTAAELGRWAQIYCLRNEGYFPPEADVERNADGSFTIHLYEIVSVDGFESHTATAAWYTVDAYGCGTDDIFGTEVRLFR